MSYVKLHQEIFNSTIWQEGSDTRLVWITLLVMADKHGEVMTSVPGLASMAKVPLPSVIEALEKFLAPDEWSRTKDDEGRRLEGIEGGFLILNYDKYRLMASDAHRKEAAAERQRRYRERQKRNKKALLSSKSDAPVTPEVPIAEAEAEAEAEVESQISEALASSCSSKMSEEVLEIYQAYPLKKGKKPALAAIEKALKKTTKEKILSVLPKYLEECRRNKISIAYPATWFNAERWDDEYSKPHDPTRIAY